MTRRARAALLALVLVQAAHSIEEYATRLYDVFPPARYVTGLISDDRRVGFVIFNVALVAFGLWCYLGPVRREAPWGRTLAWFWAVLELLNGLVHAGWALFARGYRPGLATAPFLFAAALWLAWQLARDSSAVRSDGRAGRSVDS